MGKTLETQQELVPRNVESQNIVTKLLAALVVVPQYVIRQENSSMHKG